MSSPVWARRRAATHVRAKTRPVRRRLARQDPGRFESQRWRELVALGKALEHLADVAEAKRAR